MVYSVERKERAVRGSGSHYDVDDREEEDGGGAFVMERSKPLLHNFNLPFLKWGNQRHLRCMKAPDSTTAAENAGGGKYGDGRFSIVSDVAADRHRRNRSPPPSRFGGGAGNYDVRRFRPPRFDGGGGGEEGIEAVREKLMLDLKVQADKMKNQILRRNQVSDEDDDDDDSDEEEEEHEDEGDKNQERKLQSRPQSQSPIPAPPVAAAPTAADKSQEEARPWNLRTRRAACKAPTLFGGNSAATAKGLRIEEKKGSSSNNNNNSSPLRSDGAKSPRLRGEKREREEKERPKFSVGLSKKEIEDDFMQMLGHRPARRPKKRPRAVQRQLDTLFPGLWLTEVTADAYKVPEIPETGKR